MSMTIALLQSQGAGASSMIAQFLPIAAIVAIFYFLVIRPASRQRRKTEEMLTALKKGDRVVTSGGIHGQIQSVDGDIVWLKIADNVKIKVSKAAVASLVEGSAGGE